MIALFDDLPDLSLIEIFSYLSCVDALWAFNNLNTRLTTLLFEKGFYRHVNLSSTGYYRFKTFLSLLRLNEIQSLVIDCYASSLQLRTWPYLPHLKTLKVKGVQDFIDLFHFSKQHADTLTHFSVQSSEYFKTEVQTGITKDVSYPSWNLCEFITEVIHHLTALRSLDFGMERTFFLHRWPFQTIQTPLINLTITIIATRDLFLIMSTEPLAHTLQQLHITISGVCIGVNHSLGDIQLLPRMETLQIFSFFKSFNWYFNEEWTLVDALTSSVVMPILQRMNFSVVIDANDFVRMSQSAIFTDFRHVDVRYAVIINDDRLHMELCEYILHYTQYNFRQIASATFICECWPDSQPFKTPGQYYSKKGKNRQHIFYTLPWIFNEFFPLCVPDRCVSEIQVFNFTSQVNKIYSSRLIKLNMSDNITSSTTFFSHIMSPNQVVELHVLRCDRQIAVNLPNLNHLILTDSLDSLNSSSLPRNIRSIQIVLHHQCLRFSTSDWTTLRKLSSLPLLNSLRILLYDMHISPNDTSCQVIAEAASMVFAFSFCFRRLYYQGVYDIDLAYMNYCLFIEQLRNRILALPLNEKPYVVVEEEGCGIIVWF